MIKIAGFPFSPEFDRPTQRKCRVRRFQPYSISQEMITPTTWSATVDLTSFPTQKEDLKITKDESKRELQISGLSKTSEIVERMKIESVHNWERTLSVPKTVDFESLSSKFDGKNLLFTADRKFGRNVPINFLNKSE
ncbi:Oidioi.mRNA.OKI2018_I69.PAR.g12262.t1.cds [Oikopleura dioica]|uniref:Oidioi.mRNA.OKI2018_I69.PAR.g12262.t1.cds n=1 Tax=Oikopleura dioica TaxID=34765 RepID=A0ABN7S3T0_OIKDI|nr:Oidioi.mRNA.OKI2018_I69.PAR.g12262.t1.cds [Oikopleura dioica]